MFLSPLSALFVIATFLVDLISGHTIALWPKAKHEHRASWDANVGADEIHIDLAPPENGTSLNQFSRFDISNRLPLIESAPGTHTVILQIIDDAPTQIEHISGLRATSEDGMSNPRLIITNPKGITCFNCTLAADAGLYAEQLDQEAFSRGILQWIPQTGFVHISGEAFSAIENVDMRADVINWTAVGQVGPQLALHANHIDVHNAVTAKSLQLFSKSTTLHAKGNLGGIEQVVIDTGYLDHAGQTRGPKIVISADNILVQNTGHNSGILGRPWEVSAGDENRCLAAQVEVAARQRLQNNGYVKSFGGLNASSPTISNDNGLVHGCDVFVLTKRFSQSRGKLSSADTMLVSDLGGVQSEYVINEASEITSTGSMDLKTRLLENKSQQPNLVPADMNQHVWVYMPQPNGNVVSTQMIARIKFQRFEHDIVPSTIRAHEKLHIDAERIQNNWSYIHAKNLELKTSRDPENVAIALQAEIELFPDDVKIVKTHKWAWFFHRFEWDHRTYFESSTLSRLHHNGYRSLWFDRAKTPHFAFLPEQCHVVNDLGHDQTSTIKCQSYIYKTHSGAITGGEKLSGKVHSINQKLISTDFYGNLVERSIETRVFSKEDVTTQDQIVYLRQYFDELRQQGRFYRFVPKIGMSSSKPSYGLVSVAESLSALPFDSATAITLLAKDLGRLTDIYLPAEPAIEQAVVERALAEYVGYHSASYMDMVKNGYLQGKTNGWVLGRMPSIEQLQAMKDGEPVIWWLFLNGVDDSDGYEPVPLLDRLTAAQAKSHMGPAMAGKILELDIESGEVINAGRLIAFGGHAHFYSNGRLHIQCGSVETSDDLTTASKEGGVLLEGCKQRHKLSLGNEFDKDRPIQILSGGTHRIVSQQTSILRNVRERTANMRLQIGDEEHEADFVVDAGVDSYAVSGEYHTDNGFRNGIGVNQTDSSQELAFDVV